MCPEPFDKLRTALVEGRFDRDCALSTSTSSGRSLSKGHNNTPAKALGRPGLV